MKQLEKYLPVHKESIDLRGTQTIGLVIVDAGVAFTRSGALSDPTRMIPMVQTISSICQALKRQLSERLRIVCFLDTHHADIPEPPYPPHGIIGTGEEEIDPDLRWLLEEPNVTVIRKDCINGFIGSIDLQTGENAIVRWMKENTIGKLLVTGDCTDICVSDFVVTMLSARNHGMFSTSEDREGRIRDITNLDIAVLEYACETYDSPSHNCLAAHHAGLWFMGSRGAIIANSFVTEKTRNYFKPRKDLEGIHAKYQSTYKRRINK